MSAICYVEGDAMSPSEYGLKAAVKVVAHLCNSRGVWGAGFVRSVSKRDWRPEAYYKAWTCQGYPYDFYRGEIQPVYLDDRSWIVNMVTDDFYQKDYTHLAGCLDKLEQFMNGLDNHPFATELHIPRIGAGIFGGDWGVISKMLDDTINGPVFVYDLPKTGAKNV